jgi:hypothetical protein
MEDIIETFQKLMMVHVDLFRVLMMMMRTSSFFSLGHWVNGRLALMFGSQKALLGLIGKQGKFSNKYGRSTRQDVAWFKGFKGFSLVKRVMERLYPFVEVFGRLKFKNYAHLFNEVLHLIKLLHRLHRFLVKSLGEFFNCCAKEFNKVQMP